MKRKLISIVEFAIIMTIFILCGLHIWDMVMSFIGTQAVISDYGNNHLTWWQPLIKSFEYSAVATFFLFWAYKMLTCNYTKIASIMYACNSYIYLLYMITLWIISYFNISISSYWSICINILTFASSAGVSTLFFAYLYGLRKKKK